MLFGIAAIDRANLDSLFAILRDLRIDAGDFNA
jgi:hypothetical protein